MHDLVVAYFVGWTMFSVAHCFYYYLDIGIETREDLKKFVRVSCRDLFLFGPVWFLAYPYRIIKNMIRWYMQLPLNAAEKKRLDDKRFDQLLDAALKRDNKTHE